MDIINNESFVLTCSCDIDEIDIYNIPNELLRIRFIPNNCIFQVNLDENNIEKCVKYNIFQNFIKSIEQFRLY